MESKKLKEFATSDLVSSSTDLTNEDTQLLLEVSHALPAMSNLENGDTYINVLTQSENLWSLRNIDILTVIFERNIVGETVEKADEPAVYEWAWNMVFQGAGLIGIIDEGRVMVRHTVSPIYNDQRRVIECVTYKYEGQ